MALRRSLALLSLGTTSTTSCCRASTSTAHLLPSSILLSQQPPSSSSSFHTSAPAQEKKRKQVARLRKKANLERRHKAQEQLHATAPDPIRGFGPNNEQLWYGSELRKILLFPEEVYEGKAGEKGMLEPLADEQAERLGPKGITSDEIVAKAQSDPSSSESIPLPYFNFALSSEDGKLLLKDLPQAAETLFTANNSSQSPQNDVTQPSQKEANTELVRQAEAHKAEATRRIMDLANANARGIRFENTRRILRRFGQGEGPGRSEVQAAVLTMRIHNMADHLQRMPHDIHSKRHITRMIMDRTKILRYLKRYDLQRYVQCLQDIGVEPRAVEGSVIVKFK